MGRFLVGLKFGARTSYLRPFNGPLHQGYCKWERLIESLHGAVR